MRLQATLHHCHGNVGKGYVHLYNQEKYDRYDRGAHLAPQIDGGGQPGGDNFPCCQHTLRRRDPGLCGGGAGLLPGTHEVIDGVGEIQEEVFHLGLGSAAHYAGVEIQNIFIEV